MNDVVAELKPPAPRAASMDVRRAGLVRNTWEHNIAQNVDWRAALDREYWGAVAEKFRPGDEVSIHSWDHRIQYKMLILDVNTMADPVYLNIVFLPVYPPDWRLPELPAQKLPRYSVRQADGGGLWNVVDLTTGRPVHDNPKDRSSALEMAGQLERGLAAAEASMRRDESDETAIAIALRQAVPRRPKPSRPRGRPRKSASSPTPAADTPPLAASAEG